MILILCWMGERIKFVMVDGMKKKLKCEFF